MLSRAKKGTVAMPEGVSILERLMGREYIQYIDWVISGGLCVHTAMNIL